MASVFRKLIKREFGSGKYQMYYACLDKEIKENRQKCNESEKCTGSIYEDMKKELNKIENKSIAAMHDRLNVTLITSVRISRSYILTVLVYLAASFFLLFDGLELTATIISMALLTLCFAYKTYEYLTNRYCYIDVQIILQYKKALEQRLIGSIAGKGEKG